MFEDTRFLAVGVAMGYLPPDIPGMILRLQPIAARRGVQPTLRVGDILQEHKFLGESECEAIATEQERRRSISRWHRVTALRLNPKKTPGYKFCVALGGAAGVLTSVFYFKNPLAISISVIGFIVMLANLGLDYVANIERSVSVSLWHATKSLFYFTVATLLVYGLFLATNLYMDDIVSRHVNVNTQPLVKAWARDVMVSISMFIIVVFALLTYSLWKYRSLQFSEARFGVMKDLFVRVEHWR